MKFFKSLIQKFSSKPVDWDELEEMLIRSDLGVPMSLRIVARLQERALTRTITAQDVVEVAREEVAQKPDNKYPPRIGLSGVSSRQIRFAREALPLGL